MLALILVASATVLVNVLCALVEAALLAVPASRVEARRASGAFSGVRLAELKANIDRPIAAILIVNTLGSTGGTVLTGILAGQVFDSAAAITMFTLGMAMVLLFIGDLMPKVLGAVRAEPVALFSAEAVHITIVALRPVVWLCEVFTRLFGSRGVASRVSEEDVAVLARLGAREGSLKDTEALWVGNALRLKEWTARDLMTPRTVVYRLPTDLPISLVQSHSAHWMHSRLPLVSDTEPDLVEGIVHRRDVFDRLAFGKVEGSLRDLMRPPLFVPETMRADVLLRTLLNQRQHLAIVADEFGGMAGVVTLEDILEALLGEEIVDEYDVHVDMQQVARERARRLHAARG